MDVCKSRVWAENNPWEAHRGCNTISVATSTMVGPNETKAQSRGVCRPLTAWPPKIQKKRFPTKPDIRNADRLGSARRRKKPEVPADHGTWFWANLDAGREAVFRAADCTHSFDNGRECPPASRRSCGNRNHLTIPLAWGRLVKRRIGIGTRRNFSPKPGNQLRSRTKNLLPLPELHRSRRNPQSRIRAGCFGPVNAPAPACKAAALGCPARKLGLYHSSGKPSKNLAGV